MAVKLFIFFQCISPAGFFRRRHLCFSARPCKGLFCAVLLTVFISGCASVPNAKSKAVDMRDLMAANAVKYQSSGDEVLHLFGEPANRTRIPSTASDYSGDSENMLREMWAYSWVYEKPPDAARRGWKWWGRKEEREMFLKTLVLSFNHEGKVIDYSMTESPL